MGETSIEWTDRTLNPGIYGCELVSPACTHCYAMGMSHRLGALVKNDRGWGAIDREAHRRPDSPHDFAFVTRLGTDFGDHRLLDGVEWSQFPEVDRG